MNNEEQNILAKLRQIIKKQHVVLIFDNIHWWDRRSLQLLKLILTNKELHTDLMNDIIHNVNCEEIIFPAIGLIEFKNALFNATLQSFSDTQVNLLYNLVNGHLQVFFEVINEINNHSFDFNATYENNKQYLSTVLEKRLKEFGADSTQILKAL